MVDIWKKLFTNRTRKQVFLTFLYLFVIFGIPLSHTCQSADKDIHHCRLESSSDLLNSDSYLEENHTAGFEQSSSSYKTDSHDLNCSACLFLLTAKVFELYPNISLYSTQTIAITQVLSQLNFIKQFKWLCSAPLRAPPIIAS